MAVDDVVARILQTFGPGGPLGGMMPPSYNPAMLGPGFGGEMQPPRPDAAALAPPPSLAGLSSFGKQFQVPPGGGLAMPPKPPMAPPPQMPPGAPMMPPPAAAAPRPPMAQQQPAMPPMAQGDGAGPGAPPSPPMALGQPKPPPMPPQRPAMPPQAPPPMPGAGVAGGGPNPIKAGERILPFTPEQAAQARSIGAPSLGSMMGSLGMGGSPPLGGGGAPSPSSPPASAGRPAAFTPSNGGIDGGPGGNDFMATLGDMMIGWGMGRTPEESLAKGAQFAMANRASRQEEARGKAEMNQTVQWLMGRGMDQETARQIARNPAALQDAIKSFTGGRKPVVVDGALVDAETGDVIYQAPGAGGGKPTDDMREYDLYAEQERAAGREPKSFSGYQIMMKEAGRSQVNIDTGVKLPTGFQWNDPKNPDAGVKPIPGGPAEQISGELAARIGMADSFLGQAPELRQKLADGGATGVLDRFQAGNVDSSDQAGLMRQMQSGTDALMRMLTGAGMNNAEAEAYAKRYLPSYTDTAESAAAKLDQLVRELESAKSMATRGRGGDTTPIPSDDGGGGWTDLGNGVRMRRAQ